MIPLRLRISGFLSYLEPAELDFESFDLACISGSNGAGKSSLLDAITWVLFGEARRKDDALINSRATAAEVTFEFLYENTRYRIQRTKPKDKTTLLEFAAWTEETGWKAITERTVRETEEKIRQTLHMDYETFTNASFFLQGKADQFAQQRPSDRKRILSVILGLEIWETYREEAQRRRKLLDDELRGANEMLAEIEDELKTEGERRTRLQQAEKERDRWQELCDARKALLDQFRSVKSRLDEQRQALNRETADLHAARLRLDERLARLDERRAERDSLRAQIASAAEIEAAYAAWQAAQAELVRWDTLAANFRQYEQQRAVPLLQIENTRARLESEQQALTERRRQLDMQQETLVALNSEFAALQAAHAALNERLGQRAVLEEVLRILNEERVHRKAENTVLKTEMNDLKERIERLKEASGADCPLCGQPLRPDDRERLIVELEATGKTKGDAFRTNLAQLTDADARQKEIEAGLRALSGLENEQRASQRRLDQLSDQRTRLEAALAGWQNSGDAGRLAELTSALANETYAAQDRARLAEIDDALKALGYDAAAHDEIRRRELAGRSSADLLRQLETARAALGPLEREVESLQTDTAVEEDRLLAAEAGLRTAEARYTQDAIAVPDLDAAEREYFAYQEQVNQSNRLVGFARGALEVLDNRRIQKTHYTERRNELTRQIARLKALEKAFSKDGIPALLIEQALPEIETQANEILDRLTAGGMSVRFATQREYKDRKRDDKRETLDILISDAAGTREYELFSGGEAFRVNFAIRLALSRVLAQRAGARLQTLVIDEGFGSQDAEGRQRLIEAINRVRSDFAKVLVITHLEELKDAFSARIEVNKTPHGSQIEVIV